MKFCRGKSNKGRLLAAMATLLIGIAAAPASAGDPAQPRQAPGGNSGPLFPCMEMLHQMNLWALTTKGP